MTPSLLAAALLLSDVMPPREVDPSSSWSLKDPKSLQHPFIAGGNGRGISEQEGVSYGSSGPTVFASPARVTELLRDPKAWPRLFPFVEEARLLPGSGPAQIVYLAFEGGYVGTFSIERAAAGHDKPYTLTWSTVDEGPYAFSPQPGRPRISHAKGTLQVDGKWLNLACQLPFTFVYRGSDPFGDNTRNAIARASQLADRFAEALGRAARAPPTR